MYCMHKMHIMHGMQAMHGMQGMQVMHGMQAIHRMPPLDESHNNGDGSTYQAILSTHSQTILIHITVLIRSASGCHRMENKCLKVSGKSKNLASKKFMFVQRNILVQCPGPHLSRYMTEPDEALTSSHQMRPR